MSTVRYFDDIPHIGRFGMLDGDGGTSWTMFYRNGTNFNIHVDEKDVSGTAFHSLWRPLPGIEPKEGESLTDNYNKFFDLVVSHSLSTLQEIDSVNPHWITLRDYLHTPAYDLKLISYSTGTDGVRAVITKGPESVGAYQFRPTTTFKNMPQTIPKHSSSDLIVLDKEADWRMPPHKVLTTDGLICYFKACEQSSTQVETGEETNASLESIESHLRLYKYGQEKGDLYATQRSKVLGIAIDTASDLAVSQHDQNTNHALLAGILLSSPTSSSHTKTLGDVIEQTETTDDVFAEQIQRWRAQIEEDVARLHSLGIYWGGREDWFYINPYTVLIDAESGDASLSLDTAFSMMMTQRAKIHAQSLQKWTPKQLRACLNSGYRRSCLKKGMRVVRDIVEGHTR